MTLKDIRDKEGTLKVALPVELVNGVITEFEGELKTLHREDGKFRIFEISKSAVLWVDDRLKIYLLKGDYLELGSA